MAEKCELALKEGRSILQVGYIIWAMVDVCYSDTFLSKVETPIQDNLRELVTWECKEHGVNS